MAETPKPIEINAAEIPGLVRSYVAGQVGKYAKEVAEVAGTEADSEAEAKRQFEIWSARMTLLNNKSSGDFVPELLRTWALTQKAEQVEVESI